MHFCLPRNTKSAAARSFCYHLPKLCELIRHLKCQMHQKTGLRVLKKTDTDCLQYNLLKGHCQNKEKQKAMILSDAARLVNQGKSYSCLCLFFSDVLYLLKWREKKNKAKSKQNVTGSKLKPYEVFLLIFPSRPAKRFMWRCLSNRTGRETRSVYSKDSLNPPRACKCLINNNINNNVLTKVFRPGSNICGRKIQQLAWLCCFGLLLARSPA